MAALRAVFAVGAVIFAALLDLAIAGFDAAVVEPLAAAFAAFAGFGPQGLQPALRSVPVYLALLVLRLPLLFAFSGTSSVLGTLTEAFTGSVTAAILAFTVLSS